MHPNYDPVNAYYDVALMHLATPVYNTTPVKLTTQAQANSYLTNNRAAVIAGWGYTTSAGPFSNVLIKANVTLGGLSLQQTWIVYQDLTAADPARATAAGRSPSRSPASGRC